ncbi:MAG: PfkB family carbohydrate kinase, partial [Candidatus Glassbacteria bacterium]
MLNLKYQALIGTGGIGSGIFFKLVGDHTLGREESREGALSQARDFCKLHIILHYVAVLLGSDPKDESTFQTIPVGRVGDDEVGREMTGLMASAGMDISHIKATPEAATTFSVCFQYPDASGGNITTARSASSLVSREDVRELEPFCRRFGRQGMALAAPEVSLEARLELLELAGRYGLVRFCALNSAEINHPLGGRLLRNTEYLAINRDEAESFAGAHFDPQVPDDFLAAVGEKFAGVNPGLRLLVTVGPRGSYACQDGRWEFTPSAGVEVVSTAGAGDASLGAVIVATAAGLPFILPGRKS